MHPRPSTAKLVCMWIAGVQAAAVRRLIVSSGVMLIELQHNYTQYIVCSLQFTLSRRTRTAVRLGA